MRRLLGGVALFFVIACVVWVAVLWRWQATSHDMNTRDIVVYLGLLPVTVFAFALLGRWAWRGAGERETQRAAAMASAANAQPAGAAPQPGVDERQRHATLQLLAARLVAAPGGSASELLAAAKAGEPRPELDAELRDEDGLPVLAARIATVDEQWPALQTDPDVEAQLVALRAQRPEWAEREPPEHVWRALAALREPLVAALDTLVPWLARLAPAAHTPAAAAAHRTPVAGATETPVVRVLVGWPLDWTDFEQELARGAVARWLPQFGAMALPGARFALSAQATSGEELLLQADRVLQSMAAQAGLDAPIVVAACHSAIGVEALEALERDGLLYHSQRRAKGRMPGEAAAVLVLAQAEWPAAPDADAAAVHLHRLALLRRDKSIDAPGRVGAQTATQALQAALAASRLEASAVTSLVGNADQHTERAAELYVAAAEAMPTLDAGEDVVSLGHVTGWVGGVGPLLVVACAAEKARSDGAPSLALALGDAFLRLALVALPAAPVAAVGAAPAAVAAIAIA